jgi:cytochrome c-type biogenesis protein CcmH
MRQRLAWVAIAVVVAVVLVIGASRDGASATAAERAQRLKETTLCPVCDGQNVLESNAPVAAAIRRQIDERVADGIDDDAIRADLAASYGDDVIAIPPSSGVGAVVWVAPVVGLAVGAAGVAVAVWRGRATAPVTVSDDDRQRVARARSGQS